MRHAVESFNWRKSLKGCDSAMLSLLLVLIIIFISTIDSPPTVAQSRFYDRADSLDWWNHRRFHLDGLKPFTAEERKALDNFQSQQVWGRSRGRVRVFYREYDTSTVATRSFLGQVTSRRNYVFFVVQDSSGYYSEHHLFELQFLGEDGKVIDYYRAAHNTANNGARK